MVTEKYAVRFPELDGLDRTSSVSLFSEHGLEETRKTFWATFDAFHSLANLVIERNRTKELGKRLEMQKEMLDIQVAEFQKQCEVELEEYTKQLDMQLQTEKRQLELDLETLMEETRARVETHSMAVEESLIGSQTLRKVIEREKMILERVQSYIEGLPRDYQHRREYIQCCEHQRLTYDRVCRIYAQLT